MSQFFNGMALVIFLAFKMLFGVKHVPLFQIQHILCSSVRKKLFHISHFYKYIHLLCYSEKLHDLCLATSVVLSNNVSYVALLTRLLMHSMSSIFFSLSL